jgi:hypothetical protein
MEARVEGNEAAVQTISLIDRHSLEISRSATDNVLRIVSPDGRTGVTVTVTAQGITLSITGGDLTLQTSGALAIDAERVALHGRNGVAITSGGDLSLQVAGDIHSEARIQNIKARLGNVNIKANDDVKLTGERIKLNA